MSACDPVALEHHVYGSTPSGFSTLHAPANVTRQDLLALERRCGYALPPGFSREDAPDMPRKATFFRLGEACVLGSAVHLGVDRTGRRGNYLCHNVILPASAIADHDGPAQLWLALARSGVFAEAEAASWDDLPGVLPSLETAVAVDAAAADSHDPDGIAVAPVALRALLSVCLSWTGGDPPALVVGDTDEFLKAVRLLESLLPRAVRWSLPFDSFVYGADWRGLALVGLPPNPAYAGGLSTWSVRVVPASGETAWRQQEMTSPMAGYLLSLSSADQQRRQAVVTCLDALLDARWEKVPEQLQLLGGADAATLLSAYREKVLERIATAGDLALARAVRADLTPADWERLAGHQSFATLLADDAVSAAVVDAAAGAAPGSPLLTWVAMDEGVLRTWLDRITTVAPGSQRLALLASVLHRLPTDAFEAEQRVLDAIRSSCRVARPDEATRAQAVAAIRGRPPSVAGIVSDRLFLLDGLGDKTALIEILTSGELAPATFGLHPEWLGPSLRALVVRGDALDEVSESLVGFVSEAVLAAEPFVSACDGVLQDESVDEGGRGRFRKALARALRSAPDRPWKQELLSACDTWGRHGHHGFFSGRDDR